MTTLLLIFAVAIFAVAFLAYGRFLRDKVFELSDRNQTPAHSLKDGVDYVPAPAPVLLGHHFSSIAGAGPILGPISAVTSWGWLPAFLWIVLGNVFFGGVHDMSALVASIRNRAKSIAEIGGLYLSRRAGVLFKLLIWLALMYVVAVFINVAQMTFNAKMPLLEDGRLTAQVPIGGGVATSALIYILLAVLFGVAVYRYRMSLKWATLIFVTLVYAGVYLGQKFPIHLSPSAWNIILLAYVAVASVTPVWILLQPRDYLSSFLLYGAVLGAGAGILLSAGSVASHVPAFSGFHSPIGEPMVPLLFVVIACGSISGFHSLVGSGTTTKQLDKERDALTVGYGAMLLEGLVAVMSVIFVMALTAKELKVLKGTANVGAIYGAGMGKFMSFIGVPETVGMAFGMLALSSFILTSTDTGTRLARYIFTELTGIKNRVVATAVSLLIPAFLLFARYQKVTPEGVKSLPAWKALWPVFGATNQLIAALALFVVMLWLIKTGRGRYWFVAGVPAVAMAFITLASLLMLFLKWGFSIVGVASLLQVVIAMWIFYEGALALLRLKGESES